MARSRFCKLPGHTPCAKKLSADGCKHQRPRKPYHPVLGRLERRRAPCWRRRYAHRKSWLARHKLTPSAAKNQYASNPERTVFDIKRLIGRKFSDRDVQRDIKHFPFKIVNKDGQPRVSVDVQGSQKTFTPEEVSAMVLGKVSFCKQM